ncbi:purine nucleoside permease [Novosphingobium flavum]|uniref:Purine nucleoside permease n=1 Tax=Novosphingobium flavum TaxID=1778672 RepID=A0A7X1FR38_9SPHN|nr:purine nucleoside permease [Novosphingobium flavum]MBC2665259.1 purine nucleoside permease [Novosphingobium flavum]
MIRPFHKAALLLGALLTVAAPAHAAPVADAATVAAVKACLPARPCAARLPVRVVVVTMFEVGADTGDKPGEFQLWRERRKFPVTLPFPQGWHDLSYDPETGVLAMVTGMGSIKSATAALAVGLDDRLDLSKAYWLVAGIAGIDPQDASIGSAAWAHYLVDGDIAHEIDAREIPAGWTSGYFALHSKGPADPAPLDPVNGEMFELNPALADWAFALTKGIKLADDPQIAKERMRFTGYPNAQKPPFVLKGDNLAAMTFWHGARLNDWANRWTKFWTRGKGEFVTSAMEETGTIQSLEYLSKVGRADRNRVMVLRAGSNFTMPPPGADPAGYLLRENEGYAGMTAALENLYKLGSVVVDELTAHWERYEQAPPR